MAKTQRKYLVGVLICSLVSIALLIVSLATEQWITADPVLTVQADRVSKVNYGLFFGNYDKTPLLGSGDPTPYSLTMTCIISDNVCALSCLSTEEERVKEVKALYEGKEVQFLCSSKKSGKTHLTIPYDLEKAANNSGKVTDNSKLINSGMWVSTIAFMAIALLFSAIGCGFTILNIFSNPIDFYASIYGLYIWFGIAAAADILALIMWGAEFGSQLTSNIAIVDTLLPDSLTSDGLASLGYSYFLIIPAEVEHLVAIGLIYYRDVVINREAKQKTIAVSTSKADNNDLIY